MKKYNIQNYVRYKKEIEKLSRKLETKDWSECDRDELIIKFLPLVENLGGAGLTHAVDRIDREVLLESEDQMKTLKSFLSKRIKGAIRRGIDINRGDMRIPEHKLNEIRRNFGRDKKMVAMFFNSIFLSIDDKPKDENNWAYQIPDESEPYNQGLLSIYLQGILKKHLDWREYEVLRLSYGLDCEKHTATEIAKQLDINGSSSYVRVSQLKKQAVDKLIENVDHSQVLDYL